MTRITQMQLAALREIAGLTESKVKVIQTFTLHLNPAPGYPTHKETVLSYLDDLDELCGRMTRLLGELALIEPANGLAGADAAPVSPVRESSAWVPTA